MIIDGQGFIQILEIGGLIFGPGAGTFVAVKAALNGTRKDVGAVKECADRIDTNVSAMQRDVTTIKTLVDRI